MKSKEDEKPVYRVIKGSIARIERYMIHDGPGIRTVVFLKGCPLRCIWCCNPEGQQSHPEIKLTQEQCDGCGKEPIKYTIFDLAAM